MKKESKEEEVEYLPWWQGGCSLAGYTHVRGCDSSRVVEAQERWTWQDQTCNYAPMSLSITANACKEKE